MLKIKMYGLGGQGVVTAGKILCHAYGMDEGKYVKALPDYGHERRCGNVLSDIRVDKDPILANSFIYDPDVVVVFADPKGRDVTSGIHEDSILLLNTEEPCQEYIGKFKECYYADCTSISISCIQKNMPNIAMLGVMIKAGLIEEEKVTNAIVEMFQNNAEKYNALIKEAYDAAKKL